MGLQSQTRLTYLMDLSLSKPWEMVKDREVWLAAVHGIAESDKTEQLNNRQNRFMFPVILCRQRKGS